MLPDSLGPADHIQPDRDEIPCDHGPRSSPEKLTTPMNQDATDRSLGLINIWQVVRKLAWELELLKSIPVAIRAGEQQSDVLHAQDARLYAQTNAATTCDTLIDWLWVLMDQDEVLEHMVKGRLGDLDTTSKKRFRRSLRDQNKSINACHQISNAYKHHHLSDIDPEFRVMPMEFQLAKEDGSVDLSVTTHIMRNGEGPDGCGPVDEMLKELGDWWYDLLVELDVDGRGQFFPS